MKVLQVPLRLEPQPEGGSPVTSPTHRGLRIRGDREALNRRAGEILHVGQEARRHGSAC